MSKGTVLWWGRSDVHYSRNGIIRQHLIRLGWEIIDFTPRFSFSAGLEARLAKFPTIDFIWVPCFRQRDLTSAAKWSKSHQIPLIFDPLISAYDKQVFERDKIKVDSTQARKLLQWESQLFQQADLVIADTSEHAKYFIDQLGVSKQKIQIIYVGADDTIFFPIDNLVNKKSHKLDVLFYGSFIPLQGPEIIVKAAACYSDPNVTWTLVGDGPLLEKCQKLATQLKVDTINFVGWLDYKIELPRRISQADIVLGVFGDTPKAGRVIPNKVFQSMAMAKPIITQASKAYPATVQACPGMIWTDAGEPHALADAVATLAKKTSELSSLGLFSYQAYSSEFSQSVISEQLSNAIRKVV